MSINADSMERIVPDELQAGTTGQETLAFHLERYDFAAKHIASGNVLDIACGVGYGTSLIAEKVDRLESITGVDISPNAIQYAKERYAHSKIKFIAADAMLYFEDNKYDVIISLETIEHLPKPELFIDNMQQLLKPNGLMITSVPVTPSVDANPHHLTDFTQKSFRKIFTSRGFSEVDSFMQIQSYSPFQVAARTEPRMVQMRKGLLKYYLQNPGSAVKRIASVFQDGFNNKYLTVVWQSQL